MNLGQLTIVQFHGGVGEIGGNKILISDRSSKVFLDFGKSYSREQEFFDFPLLQARQPKHLKGLGILPDLKGLYKDEEGDHGIDAVVLSHPHGDHWEYARFIKDDVPIHCAPITRDVILARERSSKAAGLSVDYKVANLTKERGPEVFKTFLEITPEVPHHAGGLAVRAYEVDHSIPGCYGLIVETGEGNIVYTGDLRFEGPRSSVTQEFVNRAKEAEPNTLIVEGTNVGEAQISSEDEVQKKVGSIVRFSTQLVIGSFSSGDTQRIDTFLTVAKTHGRKLALSMKQAFMINELTRNSSYRGPTLDDADILIFEKGKKTTSEYEKQISARYGSKIVDSTDVNQMQDKVILAAGFYDFNELIDLAPNSGSIFVMSQSEPFNEEMEIDYKKMGHWLEHYGLPLYQVHASGHAKPHELKNFIATVKPKKAYLIHTASPDLYKRYLGDLGIETIVPQLSKDYEL